MAKLLSDLDVVMLIQATLRKEAFAVAYFTRDREYSYYTFENLDAIIQLLKDRNADCVYMDNVDPRRIAFSIDEWFLFASAQIAADVFKRIMPIFMEPVEDE